ncbi:MAG: hypothetical protein GY903_16485 [Fuerstiella sp.]|nr:hypothetical protein [Fuerstiella sp.]MCP4856082.1 hypothetical protein [Fuerstiella sp.]
MNIFQQQEFTMLHQWLRSSLSPSRSRTRAQLSRQHPMAAGHEQLETRVLLAAADVDWDGDGADDGKGFEYKDAGLALPLTQPQRDAVEWTWWALQSQREMAVSEAETNVMHLGSHNSYNDRDTREAKGSAGLFNQIYPLYQQLETGVRHLEFDVYAQQVSGEWNYVLKHGEADFAYSILSHRLSEIKLWLDENPTEVVHLTFENHLTGSARFPGLSEQVKAVFPDNSTWITTRNDDGEAVAPPNPWIDSKSREKLLDEGTQLVVNFTENLRTADYSLAIDNQEHSNATASILFLSEDEHNMARVWSQNLLQVGDLHPISTNEMRVYATNNVNIISTDLVPGFGDQAYPGAPFNGDFYGQPLAGAIWSWADFDQAPLRAKWDDFDLVPGLERFDAIVNNGQDVAVQAAGSQRWYSSKPAALGGAKYHFALRSVEPTHIKTGAVPFFNPDPNFPAATDWAPATPLQSTFNYEWRISDYSSSNWNDFRELAIDADGDGKTDLDPDGDGVNNWEFIGPVNGVQNYILGAQRSLQDKAGDHVWINVQDFDKDGRWESDARLFEETVLENTNIAINVSGDVTIAGPDAIDGNGGPRFEISSGKLQFKTLPDFENRDDHNNDGRYEISVTTVARDRHAISFSHTKLLTIEVTNDPNEQGENQAPSFTGGVDQVVAEDAGPQAVPGWASNISPGPANESHQTVQFVRTENTNPDLFAVQPSVSADGTLTYTPAADAWGSSYVRMRIYDNGSTGNNGGNARRFLITVNPVNDPPAAPLDSEGSDNAVDEGTAAGTRVGITAVADDVDGDILTFDLLDDADGRFAIHFTSGVVTVDDPALLDGDDVHIVTVQASDRQGGTSTADFVITVNNVAPTAVDEAFEFKENDPRAILHLLDNDTDPGNANDPLSIVSIDDSGTTGTVNLSNGGVAYSPDGFFESLGEGDTALDSFEYTISDDDGGTDTATVSITVTGQNDVPIVVNTITDVQVNQNAADTVIEMSDVFADVDAGDLITATSESSDVGIVAVSVTGNMLTLDYQANQSGVVSITMTGTDLHGAAVQTTFNVVVLSPADQVANIQAVIEQSRRDGDLSRGQAKALSKKLVKALKSLETHHDHVKGHGRGHNKHKGHDHVRHADRKKLKKAVHDIEGFKKQVRALVRSHKLSVDIGNLLNLLADDLIDSLFV